MKAYLLYIAFLLLIGCSYDDGPKVLIADGEVRAYSEPDGTPIYVINKGEACAAGDKVITKQYQYLEVVCPSRGYAWVITGDPFRVEGKRK